MQVSNCESSQQSEHKVGAHQILDLLNGLGGWSSLSVLGLAVASFSGAVH